MNERRNVERINVGLKALFRKDDNEVFDAKVRNISMGGLFMETPQPLKLGTDIAVDIDAENIGRIMWVFGHVVRENESGVAIEFSNTDKTNLDLLLKAEKFMASKIKTAKKPNPRSRLYA
jgi:Tfp pilus assembly protein PilZ